MPYEPLLQRVEKASVEAMMEESKPAEFVEQATGEPTPLVPSKGASSGAVPKETPPAERPAVISFEEFASVDLRVARIIKAEAVEGADRLLRLQLDLGGESRTVFAGIKSSYSVEQLEGRLTVMVANLAPKKMRFGVSEGMVLAAGPGGEDIFLLSPDEGAAAGMQVK